MAGVTDRDFRLIVRRIGGVGVVGMEFLSAKGLVESDDRWTRLTHFIDEERPLAIQIYGNDPDTMGEAARIVEALSPDLCDINMGCPANKVLKGCRGAALMGDLPLAERIIARVRRELSIPLTVKFRLGLDERRLSYLELGRICEANGVDGVVLHPRTAEEKFTGNARWEAIGHLVDALDIPVIGNGDIATDDDAIAMFETTGCDGVMIARGATRNPWIFPQGAARLAGEAVRVPSRRDRRELILGHFRTVLEREEESFALFKLQKFTGIYALGLPGGPALRRSIQGHRRAADLYTTVEAFLDGWCATAA